MTIHVSMNADKAEARLEHEDDVTDNILRIVSGENWTSIEVILRGAAFTFELETHDLMKFGEFVKEVYD